MPGGRVLLQRPVRPVRVVVNGVLAQDEPQVRFAGDRRPVRALAAGAAHLAFGDRVRTRPAGGCSWAARAVTGLGLVRRPAQLRKLEEACLPLVIRGLLPCVGSVRPW